MSDRSNPVAGSPVSSKGIPVPQTVSFLSRVLIELWGETHLGSPVWSLSVSKSGILCGCDNGSIVMLNSNLDCCFRLSGAHGNSPVVRLSWAKDALHFLSVGTDLQVVVWELATSGELTANRLYTLPQISPVISAEFHPSTFPDTHKDSVGSDGDTGPAIKSPACTVLVLTADRRITVWTDGVVEQYESLSVKDATPVCMSVRKIKKFPFVAIGTKTGELLLYSFRSSNDGIVFEQSLTCRNRRGKFSSGTPIVSIVWISDEELLVASQDDRLRLVRFDKELSIVTKFRGHESSQGDVALGAFVVAPPFGEKIIQSGSECGRVHIWPNSQEGGSGPSFFRKLGGSHAIKSTDSWEAVAGPDKLTALAPAPWNPDKGRIGASCTVTASLDGAIRLFICKYNA